MAVLADHPVPHRVRLGRGLASLVLGDDHGPVGGVDPLVPGRGVGDPLLRRIPEDDLDLRARVQDEILVVAPRPRIGDRRDLLHERAELRLGLEPGLAPRLQVAHVADRDDEESLGSIDLPDVHLDRKLDAVRTSTDRLEALSSHRIPRPTGDENVDRTPVEVASGGSGELQEPMIHEHDPPVRSDDREALRGRLQQGPRVDRVREPLQGSVHPGSPAVSVHRRLPPVREVLFHARGIDRGRRRPKSESSRSCPRPSRGPSAGRGRARRRTPRGRAPPRPTRHRSRSARAPRRG